MANVTIYLNFTFYLNLSNVELNISATCVLWLPCWAAQVENKTYKLISPNCETYFFRVKNE